MRIDSLTNKRIKYLMKLKDKSFRDREGKFLVETLNLVLEAKASGALMEVYLLEDVDFSFDNKFIVSDEVMKKIKDIENSKIVGICKKNDCEKIEGDRFLLLDKVQDPGNVGTILRSALGFNVDMVILSNDSCDLYNPKVVRASEGAIFNLKVVRMDLEKAISYIKEMNIPILSTDVVDGVDIEDVKTNKYALIMGSEGSGVKDIYKKKADKKIYIKTNKKLESLNVAVATSILLYELDKH